MDYASLLNRLLNREDLPHDDMHELMRNIMGGQLTPAQIAAANATNVPTQAAPAPAFWPNP